MIFKIAKSTFVIVTIHTLFFLQAFCQNEIKYILPLNSELTDTILTDNGDVIIRVKVPGIPPKPGLLEKSATILPASAVVIDDVPVFIWSFGCSPTVAAMMAGYYDRNGYPDIYTGPAGGGVCPLDNTSWGYAVINDDYENLCPLSATMQGLDGRTTRGHVDDYWINYRSLSPDPYLTNGWEEHEHEHCTADFMKTSRSVYGYEDGETMFYYYSNGVPYSEENEVDGACGLKLFFESRGYNVSRWFSQFIIGYNGVTDGFTFNDFKTKINEGQPVMIHLEGHSVLGIGYDTDTETIYFHNTWDYDIHSMEWGGIYISNSYSLQMYGVSVFELEPNIVCMAPANVEVQQITSSTAKLKWDLVSVNDDFEVLYGETGFDPKEGNVLNAQDTNSLLLQNLKPETSYTVYLRKVCGGDFSDWSDSIVFVTTCSQTVLLNSGWNILSFHVTPTETDLMNIFQSLINSGKLKKVMDESGNTIENRGIYGGWVNTIENFQNTEGYKVNVFDTATVSVEGISESLPFEIALTAGWNIISWPSSTEQDGMGVFETLINTGKLKKVMDEAGRTIEDWGIHGSWRNNIGNMKPGEGYMVNVTETCTLNIGENDNKSVTIPAENKISRHFTTAFKGNGADHMNINLVNIKDSGILEGDEIGIFDGNVCVGSAQIVYTPYLAFENSISIPVSASESNFNKNGYSAGNTITLKLFRNGSEYPITIEPLNVIEPVFEKGGSLFAQVELITKLDETLTLNKSQIRCYPNPFSNEITIEIELEKEAEISVSILNQTGQMIKKLESQRFFIKGVQRLIWNGTDRINNEVVSGIYFIKVEVDKSVFHQKATMIRQY